MTMDKPTLISEANEIVQKLHDAGFKAYFAGGAVRDMLLDVEPIDIDIATNAKPEEISKLFIKSKLVGAAFGVVIVKVKNHKFEIATFRKDKEYIETNEGLLINTKGVKGQYIRFYSKGSTSSDMNHYIEAEVYGK